MAVGSSLPASANKRSRASDPRAHDVVDLLPEIALLVCRIGQLIERGR